MGDEGHQEGSLRVGFFPGDSQASRWGREIHPWSALATGALEAAGCTTVFLNRDELRDLPRDPDLDVLHLNWPQALSGPDGFKRKKYMPRAMFRTWYLRRVDRLLENLERTRVPVVWQVHDLPYAEDERDLELHRHVFDGFFRRADGLVFYERSSQPPVFELYGPPGDRALGVAHLGEYTGIHGERISRTEARRRVGLENVGRTFLYAGTVRWSRSPSQFIEAFLEASGESDRLIVSGRGTDALARTHAHPRILYRTGMIPHEEFRDLICASDFMINDAPRYLGSGVIRVALGYGVPVIARSFGCTADIAREAYVEIEETPDGLERALRSALDMSDEEHGALGAAALERDRERPWSAYAAGCIGVYRRVIEARRSAER